MSLVTPREPLTPHRESATRDRTMATESGVLDARAACDSSSRSRRGAVRRHAVNEDAYSTLDRPAPVYVVADGVGGGAMASRASRELVQRLHAALDRHRIDERSLSDALLDADRDVARAIAQHTSASGAATVALCAGTGPLLSRWLIAWVGDCRIYRLRADARRAGGAADARRHLPPSRRDAAAGRLARRSGADGRQRRRRRSERGEHPTSATARS